MVYRLNIDVWIDSFSLLWASLFPAVVGVFLPLFVWLMVSNRWTTMWSFLSYTAAEWGR